MYKDRKRYFIYTIFLALYCLASSIVCFYPPSIKYIILGYFASGEYLFACLILSYSLYKEYKWLKKHKDWK